MVTNKYCIIIYMYTRIVYFPCAKNLCRVSPTYSSTLKFLTLQYILFFVDFRACPTEMI